VFYPEQRYKPFTERSDLYNRVEVHERESKESVKKKMVCPMDTQEIELEQL